jgi:predicted enzyme related to lactoylglutathione lyase
VAVSNAEEGLSYVKPKQSAIGIGGVFFKAHDPVALAAWYREHLGISVEVDGTHAVFADKKAQLVWATFPSDTKYFSPSIAPFMLNYRAADLDAMLEQLRAAHVPVDERIEESEFGRFGWATDPEGNRFELWQPPAE